jgi:16S rRNA (guanine527-N7)-methyltransferase
VPDEARGVFTSDRLPLVERYAAWLADAGTVRGLIGPREVPRLWDRHLLNCGVLAEAVPAGASVADLGSGAGLPGLVLALARPDLKVTLVEPLLRRTTFLEEVTADLGLDQVRVVRGRADALHGVETFDVVTARALAPLDRLVGWAMPLVRPSGVLLAMKGDSAEAEIADGHKAWRDLGCATPDVLSLGEGRVPAPTRVVRVAWAPGRQVGWPLAPGRQRPGPRKVPASARRSRKGRS